MANALVLETLSLKELGALGSSVRLKYWQHLRKGDLLDRLSALNRVFTQEDLDVATAVLARKQAARAARSKGALEVPSQGVLNENSEASTLVQPPNVAVVPCVPTSKSQRSEESPKNKDQISKTTVRIGSDEIENDVATSSESAKPSKESELKARSKNQKSSQSSESTERPTSSESDGVQKLRQAEPSLTCSDSSAVKNAAPNAVNARLSAEKVVRVAEQIVPMLAERLAKRLAECLTKELALEDDANVLDVSNSPDAQISATCAKDARNDSNVADVASKLIDKIMFPTPEFPSSTTESSKLGATYDSEKTKTTPTKEIVVKETLKDATISNRANVQEETSGVEDDDVLIETVLPASKSSNVSKNLANGSCSDQTDSLKDRLRLKKLIGSPNDKTDRLVLLVCDPYWIRACWEVTTQLVERVRSAMARHWHTADPILRLYRIEPTTARREFVKDVEISGGVSNWYVPVDNPPSSFAVELGYKSRDGQFFTLLSSNAVQTPKQFVRDSNGRPCTESFSAPFGFQTSSSDRWMQKTRQTQAERRSSLDESPVKTFAPSESAVGTSLSTNEGFISPSTFLFQADAEVLFTGRVSNGATVKVREEPVCQAPDGSFSIRFSLPERRHVFPIVATSRDENETQTIIVAIERNTKTLDPVYKDDEEE